MDDEQILRSKYKCRVNGCMRHPSRGDYIIRVNNYGEPFVGECAEHNRVNKEVSRVS